MRHWIHCARLKGARELALPSVSGPFRRAAKAYTAYTGFTVFHWIPIC